MRAAVHIDPPLAMIPAVLDAAGVHCFQTTLRDPQRFGKTGIPEPADCDAYRQAAAGRDLWGMVHGSLLTNLASPEGRIRNSSVSSIVGDLKLAAELGLRGVCFHVGYAKGHPDRATAMAQASRKLASVLEQVPPGVAAVIENACEGTELGVDLAEVGQLVRAAGVGPERLAVLIDTCHLHAAGTDMSGPDAGSRLADGLAKEGLLGRLLAFHLNDCQGALGCRRDRHAAPGEGSIGEGLASIGRHAAFRGVPGILEVGADETRRGLDWLNRAGALE